MTRRSVALVASVAALAAVLIIAAVVWFSSSLGGDDAETATPTHERAPEGLEDFYTQQIEWSDCDEGDARCATATVPVDYDDPEGETIELALLKAEATGEKQGTIFVNPGGPGGSAQEFAAMMAARFPDEVREIYDIVGVDPRGVGDSTPLQCLDDADFDAYIALDPDPQTPEGVEALREGTRAMGEACRDNSGELAAHVSTEEVARDQDVVRAALGEESMIWFGASYGTQLGAQYADLFPEKVDRMVLDGGLDPSLGSIEVSLGQAEGFQRALDAYIADCLAQDECPLGDSAQEAVDTISSFMEGLKTAPLVTPGGRELTEGQAFYGIAVTLYAKESWYYLTSAFEAALGDSDPRAFLQLADIYFDRNPEGRFLSNSGQVIYAVNCLDSPVELTVEEVESEWLPRFREASPVFGGALGWGIMSCSDWPIEATHPQGGVTAEGAEPIVVVGTTRDPATPYEWSQSLAKELDSGVLVTREGDGHTGYGMGNPCVDDAINTYLVDGTVPEDGLTCGE